MGRKWFRLLLPPEGNRVLTDFLILESESLEIQISIKSFFNLLRFQSRLDTLLASQGL